LSHFLANIHILALFEENLDIGAFIGAHHILISTLMQMTSLRVPFAFLSHFLAYMNIFDDAIEHFQNSQRNAWIW